MGFVSLSNTKWTIGVCITVQIGERGIFTDVQIGERGKQRVNIVEARLKNGWTLMSVLYDDVHKDQ